jgi:hypothetical protein
LGIQKMEQVKTKRSKLRTEPEDLRKMMKGGWNSARCFFSLRAGSRARCGGLVGGGRKRFWKPDLEAGRHPVAAGGGCLGSPKSDDDNLKQTA